MRILLIEDEHHDVERVLHTFGDEFLVHRVSLEVVRSGGEALDRLLGETDGHPGRDGGTPHLILLDLGLPGVDGLEVLRRLRLDPRTRLIPVVTLTGSGSPQHVRQCYDLGANSYVVKPSDPRRFAEALQLVSRYWTRLNEPPDY